MFEKKLFGMPMFRKKMFSQVPFGESGMLRFESTNDTITPALTLSGGPTPLWQVQEAGGGTFIYESASFSHTKTAGTGNLTVRLVNTEAVKSFVTQIDLTADGIASHISRLNLNSFNNLSELRLRENASLFGDFISAIGLLIEQLSIINVYNQPLLTGDFTGINLGTALGINLHLCNFSGGMESTVLNPNIIQVTRFYNNNFTTAPRISGAVISIPQVEIQNNSLAQAAVDQIVLDIYNNRANFTYATPALNVGGTNAAPSGIYQDATPPTTGKEYIYKLVNDPDLEGFNKWTITYTA